MAGDYRRTVIAIAFPRDPEDRARLRVILASQRKPPMPMLYPGGVALPCAECRLVLDVGPRLQTQLATGAARLLCPYCVRALIDGAADVDVMHLDNPDSKHETH